MPLLLPQLRPAPFTVCITPQHLTMRPHLEAHKGESYRPMTSDQKGVSPGGNNGYSTPSMISVPWPKSISKAPESSIR